MSGRSSRLHALERSVKRPRRSRAKPRALTVMRLEGGVNGVQSNPRPARLPKDIEDQIAVVRGQATGRPSRGLLQLEERLLRPVDVGPTSQMIQRHDHGAVPAAAPAVSYQARALSGPSVSEFGGSYNVESFEDGRLTGQPASSRNEYYAGADSGALLSPPASAVSAPGDVVCNDPSREIPVHIVGPASEREETTRRPALTPEQSAVAANFERDVAALLDRPTAASAPEDRQWEETVRNAAAAPTVPTAPAVVTPETTAAPKRDPHEVFNQMGLAMNYANSFDLGAMDLSARLDRFDEELALSPKATPTAPVPVQALTLDDFDLVADLAEISGAQSAPPPAAAVPASEPSTQVEDVPAPAPT